MSRYMAFQICVLYIFVVLRIQKRYCATTRLYEHKRINIDMEIAHRNDVNEANI